MILGATSTVFCMTRHILHIVLHSKPRINNRERKGGASLEEKKV